MLGFAHPETHPPDFTLPVEPPDSRADVRLVLTITISRADANAALVSGTNDVENVQKRAISPTQEIVAGTPTIADTLSKVDSWKVLMDRLSGLMGVMDTLAKVRLYFLLLMHPRALLTLRVPNHDQLHPWLNLAWGVVSFAYKVCEKRLSRLTVRSSYPHYIRSLWHKSSWTTESNL